MVPNTQAPHSSCNAISNAHFDAIRAARIKARYPPPNNPLCSFGFPQKTGYV